MLNKESGQAVEDIIVAKVLRHLKGQTFPGIFIHDDKETERSPIGGAEGDKVIRPDLVTGRGPKADTRAISQPEASAFRLLLRDLQPLLPPDAFHTFMINAPAISA
jgi:hypothetical protein